MTKIPSIKIIQYSLQIRKSINMGMFNIGSAGLKNDNPDLFDRSQVS